MDPIPMRVLVVGQGGREAAICRALTTADPVPELLIAPGNAGTAAFGQNVQVDAGDVDGLLTLAMREGVDLVIPGPELPLVHGLADRLAERNIPCCGPSRAAAALEGSKLFMREVAAAAGAPSPHYVAVKTVAELDAALAAWHGPVPVVKADGLAAGKGVLLRDTKEETREAAARLLEGELGDAGRVVLLEERLTGVEASLFYACDGEMALPLPHAKDYKRVHDDDRGPNTGGMGAVSPNPHVNPAIEAEVLHVIVEPVLRELARRGTPYRGFLYAGLMLTPNGPRLLEFNARLGDPEAQVILPLLAPGVFLALCAAMGQGKLVRTLVERQPYCTCAVVLAAEGYPEAPVLGDVLEVADDFESTECWMDPAGAKYKSGKLLSTGGRIAAVVARGKGIEAARAAAYDGVRHVHCRGMHYRKDIGARIEMPGAPGTHPSTALSAGAWSDHDT